MADRRSINDEVGGMEQDRESEHNDRDIEAVRSEGGSEWDKESLRSDGRKGENGQAKGGKGVEERVENQIKRKKEREETMKKKKNMEEKLELEIRMIEMEGEKRRQEVRREQDMSLEEREYEIDKRMREILGAVSREDSKAKVCFNRADQQTVKHAVFEIQNMLIKLLLGQRRIEKRNEEMERECRKLEKEKEEM